MRPDKSSRNVLMKCEGCIGCTKKCLRNGPVATKEVAMESKGKIFPCNSINTEDGHKKQSWMGKVFNKIHKKSLNE